MEKFIPVVVIKELSETDKILTALKASGINTAEITFRTACAAEAIAYACEHYPDMSIGAGTVINATQCEAALAAGAQFIVSPGLSVAVAEICKAKNIPYYPGCVTKGGISRRYGTCLLKKHMISDNGLKKSALVKLIAFNEHLKLYQNELRHIYDK